VCPGERSIDNTGYHREMLLGSNETNTRKRPEHSKSCPDNYLRPSSSRELFRGELRSGSLQYRTASKAWISDPSLWGGHSYTFVANL
jgi:hypothetical protein